MTPKPLSKEQREEITQKLERARRLVRTDTGGSAIVGIPYFIEFAEIVLADSAFLARGRQEYGRA